MTLLHVYFNSVYPVLDPMLAVVAALMANALRQLPPAMGRCWRRGSPHCCPLMNRIFRHIIMALSSMMSSSAPPNPPRKPMPSAPARYAGTAS